MKGKLIGGIIGLFAGDLLGLPMGGLTGFIAGSLLGHYFIDMPRERAASDGEFKAYQRRQGEFLYHVVALCAKIAKSDGAVNRQEVNFMEQLMARHFRLSDRGRQHAIQIWKETKTAPEGFEYYAHAFFRDFGRERHQVLNMMDLLFAVASSDGNLHPREEELLLRAAGIFHIGRLQYDRIKSRYYQARQNSPQQRYSPLDPHYAILGAQPNESMDHIKKKYRALVMQWHPDKVTARGASPEALRHAQEKFRQINEAYEKIVDARK